MLTLAAQAAESPDNTVAIIAVVIAGLGLIATIGLWLFERHERRKAAPKHEALQTEVKALRAAQVEILERVARSTEAMAKSALSARDASAQSTSIGAELSARIHRPGRVSELVVTNMGPGAAQLREVEAVDAEHDGIVALRTGLDERPVDLLPHETHTVAILLGGGTRPTAEFRLKWNDSSGPRERVQVVATV